MRKKLIISCILLIVAVSVGVFVYAQNSQVRTGLDLNKLSKVNITLDMPTATAKINPSEAIATAKKAFPQFTNGAKEVNVEYQLVTNQEFKLFSAQALEKNPTLNAKGYMDKLPVYIITFKGLEYKGFGCEPGCPEPPPFHESNIIIDAMTGEPLMSFACE